MNWKDKHTWFGAIFSIFALLVVCNQIGAFFGLDKATWSGWVQAFGSIGAIFGAFMLAGRQQRNADESRNFESALKTANLSDLSTKVATEAYQAIHEVTRRYQRHVPNTLFKHEPNRLRNAHAILLIVLAKDIPADLGDPLIKLHRLIDVTIRSVQKRNKVSSVISQATIRLALERSAAATQYRDYISAYAQGARSLCKKM